MKVNMKRALIPLVRTCTPENTSWSQINGLQVTGRG